MSDQKPDPEDENWDDVMIRILRAKLTDVEAKAYDARKQLELCDRKKKRAKMQRMTELQALQDELRLYNAIDIEPTDETSDTIIRELLRQNEELHIYKLAMESMAKQFIHPRMTALELAELQLRGKTQ